MMDIPKLRLLNQQLANPLFHSPKELVSWMGAVQAQDYAMAKWAVGMRLGIVVHVGAAGTCQVQQYRPAGEV